MACEGLEHPPPSSPRTGLHGRQAVEGNQGPPLRLQCTHHGPSISLVPSGFPGSVLKVRGQPGPGGQGGETRLLGTKGAGQASRKGSFPSQL